ncbi:unnamed protein product [Cyclocybe aegerita]|uniref:glucan 1,3-beta-glucosidase n=1 Tax=Cyclocybe aegerita TaxID=1973307 RepID=A0A8S0WKQ7_CYCAE|nr:unnamed protein product [Cyclocybe aegerita]
MLFTAVVYGLSLVHSINALTFGFPYGSQKVRGVNLGGWLVLEPWITPSLFDSTGDSRIVDEYTFGQYQDRAKALATLKKHWDSWITEADFKAIAAAGLNHVRLPIGYWAFDVSGGEPFVQGQLPYLTKAITWAQKYGLKVIIDLHGVPGSQNGYDNSGQKKSYPLWHTQQSNVDRSNAIIKRIASTYKDMTGAVPVIAPLNEPAGYFGDDVMRVVRQYWYDSYGNIRWPYRTSRQSNTVVMIHDAFQPSSYWSNFMSWPNWEGVIMDKHVYQVFSVAENQMTNAQHIQTACAKAADLTSNTLWTVVGEWSPAPNDCAKYLNARGVGSRYDGTYPGSTRVGSCDNLTGSGANFTTEYKTFLRQFWEAQVISYEKAQGWIQWTWKAENADEWSYQAGLKYGWIPQKPTDLKYSNICI